MSSWIVIPCLLTLREEFNKVSPNRDKGADGTIGDASHTSSSDHTPDEDSDKLRNKDSDHVNEVHALDIDSSGPWPDGVHGDVKGSWFDNKIHDIIAEEKRRWNDPNDMCRLNYIIWRGVIYDKDNNWVGVDYTGSDDHTNHAHFSGRYETQAENDTRPWGVWEEEMSAADFANAFKDPSVQAAFRTMLATAYSDDNGIQIYNKANDENPKEVKRLGEYTTGGPGTATDRIENKVGEVLQKLDELAQLLASHNAGLVEGKNL